MKIKLVSLFFAVLFLSSCVYTNIKIPLDDDVNNTQLGEKVGYSRAHSIAWLVAWGDSGTHAAAVDGNIQTIQHLDLHFISILFGLYTQHETIAYGN